MQSLAWAKLFNLPYNKTKLDAMDTEVKTHRES